MESNFKPILQNDNQRQLISIKRTKYRKIVEDYLSNLGNDTKKLLSYRQRKELVRFEKVFQFIAQISADISLMTYINIDQAFFELFNEIKFKLSQTLLGSISDAEIKILFLLMKLKEIGMRLKEDFVKMTV